MKTDVTAQILDTRTGKRATYRYEASFEDDGTFQDHHWWTDGNFGCDCNRGLISGVFHMGDYLKALSNEGPPICGTGRFIVEKIVRNDTGATVYSESEPSGLREALERAVEVDGTVSLDAEGFALIRRYIERHAKA